MKKYRRKNRVILEDGSVFHYYKGRFKFPSIEEAKNALKLIKDNKMNWDDSVSALKELGGESDFF